VPSGAGVAELVKGIEWPCGLLPVVVGELLDPHRAVFATVGHAPDVVGAALGDELERLGFAVRSVGPAEVLATGSAGELQVRLHGDGHEAFPAAPRHSVAVELRS
jgi:hypothetical protein